MKHEYDNITFEPESGFIAKNIYGIPMLVHLKRERGVKHSRMVRNFQVCLKKGSQFKHVRWTKDAIHLPVVHTRSGHATVIIIDIDNQTPEDRCLLLDAHSEGKITIGVNASGNIKGAFTITHPCQRITSEKAMATVRAYLGDAIANRVDPAGMFSCESNQDMLDMIREAKSFAVPVARVEKGFGGQKFHKKLLPQIREAISSMYRDGILTFAMRLASWSRGKVGMEIPVEWWAKELGCSAKTVSRYIKRMIQDGNLELVDGKYEVGRKGKTYRFAGRMLSLVEMIVSLFSLRKGITLGKEMLVDTPLKPKPVPSKGNWNHTLWTLTNFFKSGFEFMQYVAFCNTTNKKDHEYQAKYTWNNHARKNGLATI